MESENEYRSTPGTHLFRQLRWDDLDPVYLRQLIFLAKEEDFEGSGLAALPKVVGDISTSRLDLKNNLEGEVAIIAREEMIVAGLPLIPMILEAYGEGCVFKQKVEEGSSILENDVLAEITGPAPVLLSSERVILNFLQHLSGIATQTASYVAALGDSKTRLLDTRKTTPGYRVLEKYAVAQGGGWNHRMGLFEWVLLKDNHLAVSRVKGGHALAEMICHVREGSPGLAIEVEVDNLTQIDPVLEAGAEIILFDNFSLDELREAVNIVGNRAIKEASGGITYNMLPKMVDLGLDFISVGALIHQSTWIDIGLDWVNHLGLPHE